jgi:hypothetical protein
MRKWLTAFVLVASMLGGAVGVSAHESKGSMTGMPDCCRKAQLASRSPQSAVFDGSALLQFELFRTGQWWIEFFFQLFNSATRRSSRRGSAN